jgi:hypothetical protein
MKNTNELKVISVLTIQKLIFRLTSVRWATICADHKDYIYIFVMFCVSSILL